MKPPMESVPMFNGSLCWPVQTQVLPNGYARAVIRGTHVYLHRASYALFIGPIPRGMTIDHLCGTRNCINPFHLEVVTRGENALRGNGPAAINKRKELAPCGHPYDGTKKNGAKGLVRICVLCYAIENRRRAQEWRDRQKAQAS